MPGLFGTLTSVSESKPWFLSLVDQLGGAWAEYRNPTQPTELTAAPVDVPEIWSKRRMAVPRLVSAMLHICLTAVALIPLTKAPKPLPKGIINVALYAPSRLSLPPADSGGGGGGKHAPAPPSLGKLPKPADKQFVPPDPEPPKNLDPSLIVEATVVAPHLPFLPHLNLLNIGDPDGIAGPASGGPGSGYGIGPGDGHGIGDHKGPGVGPDDGGGYSKERFRISGAISNPVLITQVLPEYSEEARKARYEGRVILDTTILADGSVRIVRVLRGIGFGLDEKAIAAVLQWRFKPARMDGKPVPVALNVEVNFNLR
jgi:TonB family protein